MKVLVVNAAPRMESGNTQTILNPFVVGMRDAGADVDILILGKKKIKPCIGCFTCYAKTPGICIHQDDMVGICDRVEKADILVLATPLYIDGMTSLAKRFIERLVVFLDPHFTSNEGSLSHALRRKFPDSMFVVSVCGYPGVQNFDPLLDHVKAVAKNFHCEYKGALLRPAAFSILLAGKYPEKVRAVLDAVRKSGFDLIANGSVSGDLREKAATDICSTEELMTTANAYWDRQLLNE